LAFLLENKQTKHRILKLVERFSFTHNYQLIEFELEEEEHRNKILVVLRIAFFVCLTMTMLFSIAFCTSYERAILEP